MEKKGSGAFSHRILRTMLVRFGETCLPFFTLLARIEHIIEVTGLEDMRREDAITVPRVAVG